jgi:hypothetical protein
MRAVLSPVIPTAVGPVPGGCFAFCATPSLSPRGKDRIESVDNLFVDQEAPG